MRFIKRLAECLYRIDACDALREMLARPPRREEEALTIGQIERTPLQKIFEPWILCRFDQHLVIWRQYVMRSPGCEKFPQDCHGPGLRDRIDGNAEEVDAGGHGR